jgi:GntR family transcriptional regulator
VKFRHDRTSAVPIHQQLRDQIQTALHVGKLRPGDRLPSLRDMARRNQVSTKTVLRAYWALRDQGLVEVRAGSGAIVGGETVEHPEEEQALALV